MHAATTKKVGLTCRSWDESESRPIVASASGRLSTEGSYSEYLIVGQRLIPGKENPYLLAGGVGLISAGPDVNLIRLEAGWKRACANAVGIAR